MILSLLLAAALQSAPGSTALPPPPPGPDTAPPPVPTNRLPPANPLPYADPDVANVMAPFEALLAAIPQRDEAAILALTQPDGRVTTAIENADGTHMVRSASWAEFAHGVTQGSRQHYEERLIGQPAVEVDGNIAMIWAPYVFLADHRVHHCGTDLVALVRVDGTWKIQNVTDSHRTTGCPAE